MATFGNVDLRVEDRVYNAGAVFGLSDRPSRNTTITIPIVGRDGNPLSAEGQLLAGNRYVYVRVKLPPPIEHEEALQKAHEVAQRVLDLTVRDDCLTTLNAHEEHLVWWRRQGKITLRCTLQTELPISMRVDESKVGVVGSDGQFTSMRRVWPEWHAAFRYYRMSQATDDLFDSYRNLYLAFESLLSTDTPPGKSKKDPTKAEGEREWLQRALCEIKDDIDLAPLNNPSVARPDKIFFDKQYQAYRCTLFHGKQGRQPLHLPNAYEDRRKVETAHAWLSHVVIAYVGKRFSIALERGGYTPWAWSSVVKTLVTNIAISSDATPFNKDQTTISPAGLPCTDLETTYIGAIDDGVGYEHAFLGEIAAHPLWDEQINTVGTHSAGQMTSRELVGPLVLVGVSKLQVMSVHRLVNTGNSRKKFRL